jgi:hypothetical protein
MVKIRLPPFTLDWFPIKVGIEYFREMLDITKLSGFPFQVEYFPLLPIACLRSRMSMVFEPIFDPLL